jgi:hypothetical protein
MSISEIVVAGLAVAVLMTGLATGVLADQASTRRHAPLAGGHFVSPQAQHQN